MTIKFEAELEEAVQFEVVVKETNLTYAEHLLVIINNAREYKSEFYKVENNPKNSVYVTCPKKSAESVKDFLEWHGEVVAERKVFVCKPEYVYSKQTSDFIDKLFEDDELFEIVTLAPEELY